MHREDGTSEMKNIKWSGTELVYMGMESRRNIMERQRQKRMVQVNILSTPLQEQGLKFMHRSMQILQAMM